MLEWKSFTAYNIEVLVQSPPKGINGLVQGPIDFPSPKMYIFSSLLDAPQAHTSLNIPKHRRVFPPPLSKCSCTSRRGSLGSPTISSIASWIK